MTTNYKRLLPVFLLFLFCITSGLAKDKILRFSRLNVDNGLPQNTIHGIIKDKYGFMWFGTWAGLCRYDGYSFKVFKNDPANTNSLVHNRVHFIIKDSLQNLWIQTYDTGYVCRYNYSTENFTRISRRKVKQWIRDSLYRRLNYSHKHVFTKQYSWRIEPSNSLLLQRNNETGSEYIYRTDALLSTTLNDEMITDLYLDDQDNLWVGTNNGGLNVANIKSFPFRHYVHSSNLANSIIDNNIRAITIDKAGNLWIGTRNKGVTMINRTNGTYKHYERNANSLQHNNIRKIFCDNFQCIWFGTKGGLDKLDTRTNRFTHFSVKSSNYIPNNWVYDILEDYRGNLWIATFNGIAFYNRKAGNFISLPPSLFTISNVRVIFEDRKHNIWAGTEGGGVFVFKVDTLAKPEKCLKPLIHLRSSNESNSLSSNLIYNITEDTYGCIWIGTSNGLNQYNPETSKFQYFSSKNSLPDDMIVGAVIDNSGSLWISHTKGISQINTRTFEVHNFDKFDGLQENEFSEGAYYKDTSTGELFFGGINGLNSFFPEQIKLNKQCPTVYITNLYVENKPVTVGQKINNRVLLDKSIIETDMIKIPYQKAGFSIEFAALHYLNPHKNRYSYKLEGFDTRWIAAGASERRAYYSNLRPGKYVFKVKASNSDGFWNPVPRTITIKILPSWYVTWWAYLLYISGLVMFLYFVYKQIIFREELKNQVRFEKMKSKEMQELDRMKIQFFTGVSHEFRTPLSLIVDPLERIIHDDLPSEKVKNYALLMQRNTQRLMNLVNQLLDFRKIESGKLKLEETEADIYSFIYRIAETFELVARQQNIELKITGAPFQMEFDPDKMEKIIYNLLSNAFKNTPDGGKISVEVKPAENNTVNLVFSDTGVGIPYDKLNAIFDLFYQVDSQQPRNYAGSGIGLALTKQLVELHDGEIGVESKEGQGSRFTVSLPVSTSVNYTVSPKETWISAQNNESDLQNKPETAEDTTDEQLPLILVVEDNNDVQQYICSQLATLYRTLEAPNGSEGLKKASEYIPDLIISDVMMPEMDGFEFCTLVKTNELTSHIPVVLLTARQSTESKVLGYETGADAYLTKPFSSPMLLARVKNLISSRQKLRQLYSGEILSDTSIVGLNTTDKIFLEKAIALVNEHLDDSKFDINTMAEKMFLSRSQLYRKIKALSNQSVNDFINSIRMKHAAEMLLAGNYTISEIAYDVGFSQPNNFSRSFIKHFGVSPTEYLKGNKRGD